MTRQNNAKIVWIPNSRTTYVKRNTYMPSVGLRAVYTSKYLDHKANLLKFHKRNHEYTDV